MSKLRVIDMFAGIGGFSLGLHRTGGFETIATVEIDPYASKVLERRFGVPNLGDVTTCEFPDADFITAGFPCQDISNAGQRAGITGSRSGLYGHVVRALRMVRPRGALLENVAALLGRGLDRVVGDLAEIGYDAEWHCIPASAVGAPHRRDRVWIVANPQRGEGGERLNPHLQRRRPHETEQAGLGGRPISGEVATHLAYAERESDWRRRIQRPEEDSGALGEGASAQPFGGGEALADAISSGLQGSRHVEGAAGNEAAGQSLLGGRRDGRKRGTQPDLGGMADGLSTGLDGHWLNEPDIPRAMKGVPKRVDRLRCLGNSIVPQVAEIIGRAILEAEAA